MEISSKEPMYHLGGSPFLTVPFFGALAFYGKRENRRAMSALRTQEFGDKLWKGTEPQDLLDLGVFCFEDPKFVAAVFFGFGEPTTKL